MTKLEAPSVDGQHGQEDRAARPHGRAETVARGEGRTSGKAEKDGCDSKEECGEGHSEISGSSCAVVDHGRGLAALGF